jgi:hypothetical protein
MFSMTVFFSIFLTILSLFDCTGVSGLNRSIMLFPHYLNVLSFPAIQTFLLEVSIFDLAFGFKANN